MHLEETQDLHDDKAEENETSNEHENPNEDQSCWSQQQRKSPNRLSESVYSCINDSDSLILKEAFSWPDADKLRKAIKVEMDTMHSNNM